MKITLKVIHIIFLLFIHASSECSDEVFLTKNYFLMNKEQREAMCLQQIENLSKYTISNQNFSCSQKLIPQNKN